MKKSGLLKRRKKKIPRGITLILRNRKFIDPEFNTGQYSESNPLLFITM